MIGHGTMPLAMLAINSGDTWRAARLARTEMHLLPISSVPKNLPAFRQGAS
jgi:hypothetical protein